MLSFRFASFIVMLILVYSCKKDKYCPQVIVKWSGPSLPSNGVIKADKYCEHWEGKLGKTEIIKNSDGVKLYSSMIVNTFFEDTTIFEFITFHLPLRVGRFPITPKYHKYPDSIGKVFVDYSLYDDHTPYDPYRADESPENYFEICVFDTLNHKIEGEFHMRLKYSGLEDQPRVQDRELLFSNGSFKGVLEN
jgi:hypothetical protein